MFYQDNVKKFLRATLRGAWLPHLALAYNLVESYLNPSFNVASVL